MPSAQSIVDELRPLAERIVPLLGDASRATDDALRAKKKVMFEGAQGTLLDIDHGTYPFVTSSSAVAGGATTGAGIGPSRIDTVIGISKAYTTRVGAGPFPTELSDDDGKYLREKGAEFGSVTGRPRRTGWIDLPALRYAVRVNGLDGLALTKLDVLTGLNPLKVCVAYETPDGRVDDFPIDLIDEPGRVQPVYQEFAGWDEALGSARALADLPASAQRYVRFIEEKTETPLYLVSVGASRRDSIVLRDPFALT
jgi:adenylosuccinate synthase